MTTKSIALQMDRLTTPIMTAVPAVFEERTSQESSHVCLATPHGARANKDRLFVGRWPLTRCRWWKVAHALKGKSVRFSVKEQKPYDVWQRTRLPKTYRKHQKLCGAGLNSQPKVAVGWPRVSR